MSLFASLSVVPPSLLSVFSCWLLRWPFTHVCYVCLQDSVWQFSVRNTISMKRRCEPDSLSISGGFSTYTMEPVVCCYSSQRDPGFFRPTLGSVSRKTLRRGRQPLRYNSLLGLPRTKLTEKQVLASGLKHASQCWPKSWQYLTFKRQ